MTQPNYNTAFPGDSALIMGLIVADAIESNGHDLSNHLRRLSIVDLRVIVVHTAACEAPNLALVNSIEADAGLPLSSGPTWWVTNVLPAIKAEIDRRNKPKRGTSSNSPISRMKQLDLAEVAGKYTRLQRAGPGKLRGCCPMHQEKSPSFYVYIDSQRWHCFGKCGTGGDVVNLLKALMAKRATT